MSSIAEPHIDGRDAQAKRDAEVSIGPDYVLKDRTFRCEVDHYRLNASNLDDAGFSFIRELHLDSLHKLALAEGLEPPEKKDEYRPKSNTDRIDLGLYATLRSVKLHGLGFISPTGTTEYLGDIIFELHTGPDECSRICQFYGRETVYIEVFTTLERVEWLHRQLLNRPKAHLGVVVRFKAYEHIGAPGPGDRDVCYIKNNSRTRITGVSFSVDDGVGWTTPSARSWAGISSRFPL